MSRPKCCRKIGYAPDSNYFKPRGIPSSELEEVILSLDEFEAVRLADYNGMYQEEAAGLMNISRQTFGRIVESARKKIADSLINGKALKIEGGEIAFDGKELKKCPKCRRKINVFTAAGHEKAFKCPLCGKRSINKQINRS